MFKILMVLLLVSSTTYAHDFNGAWQATKEIQILIDIDKKTKEVFAIANIVKTNSALAFFGTITNTKHGTMIVAKSKKDQISKDCFAEASLIIIGKRKKNVLVVNAMIVIDAYCKGKDVQQSFIDLRGEWKNLLSPNKKKKIYIKK